MKISEWKSLSNSERFALISRPSALADLGPVSEIIENVRSRGDQALLDYTQAFDKVKLNTLSVSTQSTLSLNPALQTAIKQIQQYHQAQLPENWEVRHDGYRLWRTHQAIQRVGLYVPGGSASLVSTLMMLAIPAQIAGCPLKVVCIPPDKNGKVNPLLLATAEACGIQSIYTIGGAQAIAAMAYGTETIPKVDKIFGPGNSWVTRAKQMVSQDPNGATIDLPAGPSELMIIADETANPIFLAADLLAQAEHGPDSQVILISKSLSLLRSTQEEALKQATQLKRQSIILKSLEHARWIQVSSLMEAIDIANQYAPEHLSLQLDDPEILIDKIRAAGSVFVGHYTPETYGDYITGSNHVLPTAGFARSMSGLSLKDFMTTISFQSVEQSQITKLGLAAKTIALIEELDGHANAITVRE